MSRKMLSLAYIYEMKGEYEKSIVIFKRILDDSKKAHFAHEAKIGIEANLLAMKYRDDKRLMHANMNMEKMDAQIDKFIHDKQNSLRWFGKWS